MGEVSVQFEQGSRVMMADDSYILLKPPTLAKLIGDEFIALSAITPEAFKCFGLILPAGAGIGAGQAIPDARHSGAQT